MANYYVDPIDGNDAWDGGYLDPWKTTPYALTQVAENDTLYLIASGVEVLATPLSIPITGLSLIGVNTSLVPLVTTRYEINNSAVGAMTQIGSAVSYWQNIRLYSSTGHGISLTSGASRVYQRNCRIDGCVESGVYSPGGTSGVIAVNSEFDNNGKWGLSQSTTFRLLCDLFGCKVHHNISGGINTGTESILSSSLVYANGGIGIKGGNNPQRIINCAVYNNASHGIEVKSGMVHFSAITNNGGYGINFTDTVSQVQADFNHYHNNTSGETSLGAGNTPGMFNVDGDPLFTSITDNAEDFTPKTGSPLIRVPPISALIGAVCPISGGDPGGGFWLPNKRGNKQ